MIKTVLLTAGTETKVEISGGYNVGVINRTIGMLYASRKSGVVAGADDVAAIPAGDSYTIRAADDTVYLLATAAGDVQLESLGAKEVFKVAAARSSSGGGEGGTVDEVARVAIETHANHDEIHLTAEDAVEAAATVISNPNLLRNPDFSINQRGKAEYSGIANDYCVDGWMLATLGNDPYYFNTDGNVLRDDSTTSFKTMRQYIENPQRLSDKTVTYTVELNSAPTTAWNIQLWLWEGENLQNLGIAATSDTLNTLTATLPEMSENAQLACAIAIDTASTGEISLKNAKFELGSVATPFTPPDPAVELLKCQRYYQIHTTGDIDPIDLRPTMREITDIRQREDGNYEYIAEL